MNPAAPHLGVCGEEAECGDPYSAVCPDRFVDAAEGGITGQTPDLGLAKRFCAVSGGLVFCAPQNT